MDSTARNGENARRDANMTRMHCARHYRTIALLLGLSLYTSGAIASADSAAESLSCPSTVGTLRPHLDSLRVEGPIEIEADHLSRTQGELSHFQGGVSLRRGDLILEADEIIYHELKKDIDARGSIRLRTVTGDRLAAPRLQYQLDEERGEGADAHFSIVGAGRGEAGKIMLDGNARIRLSSVRFTSCPEGQNDWWLRAREITLDRANGIGTARGVTVEFLHVPFLHLPWFSFPMADQRKSGLLNPRFGQSSSLGFVMKLPWYFNLAPNYDDTLSARLMTKRGLQLQNEFRYLTPNSNGTVLLDGLARDEQTGEYRAAGTLRHSQQLEQDMRASLDLQWVSDKNYLADLGESTAATSSTHIPRTLLVSRVGEGWQLDGRLFGYQTVDRTILAQDRPYQRLPQIVFTGDWPGTLEGVRPQMEAEFVHFERAQSVTGQRIDLFPSLSYPLQGSYAYLVPRAGLRYTAYHLQNGLEDRPHRTVPVVSLNSGLLLEREGRVNGGGYIQTLEPRLFYVYIPSKDQTALPTFDTGIPDFTFYNLFRENRFIGADRIGDANQLALALTTRLLGPDHRERARLSLGQVTYFRDETVTLTQPGAARGSSDLVMELAAYIGDPWYLRGTLQRDNTTERIEKGYLQAHYRPRPDRIVNLGYRYQQNLQDQTDLSVEWPLSPRFRFLGRWNYSTRQHANLQTYAGLEFANCCWAFRIVSQNHVLATGEQERALQFEIELTGLGSLGISPERPRTLGQYPFD